MRQNKINLLSALFDRLVFLLFQPLVIDCF